MTPKVSNETSLLALWHGTDLNCLRGREQSSVDFVEEYRSRLPTWQST